ncbi:MAG: hypothetical protein HQ567_22150 [Candidatus Nealsonbacteria bacterium]|nr:hypothetical protein [Candidatus Nealsonbacteria bacterium]
MLFGKFGDVETRILMTTLGISAFSMTSLGCAIAEEKQTARYLSIPGLVASGIGLVFFVLGIWTDWFEAVRRQLALPFSDN